MLLQVDNLSKQYNHHTDGQVDALKDVTFSIEKGMFVTITGPSGAGKSTLLLMLGGLVHPSAGQVVFNNESLYALQHDGLAGFRRRHVGFVMQNFGLIPYLSALQNVMIPLALQTMDAEVQKKRAIELLNSVELKGRMNHLPRELSSGQQQRVAIARAMANDPSMILADEPTGNLDPALAREILDLLKALNAKKGITVIMVTHSPQAADYGTMKIHLKEGQLVTSNNISGLYHA
jgi:putative ABC transport system ATP-binding protein